MRNLRQDGTPQLRPDFQQSLIHLVSAWAMANHLALGQVKVAAKSNESTAIPQMLALLDVSSCIVTIDARGCQQDIAKQIIDQQAEYVLAIKGNQGSLLNEAQP